jgi:hypothetical protein
MAPRSQQERAEKLRRERLDLIDKQVAEGSLTIRQMTAAEKKQWKTPAADARRGRGPTRSGS